MRDDDGRRSSDITEVTPSVHPTRRSLGLGIVAQYILQADGTGVDQGATDCKADSSLVGISGIDYLQPWTAFNFQVPIRGGHFNLALPGISNRLRFNYGLRLRYVRARFPNEPVGRVLLEARKLAFKSNLKFTFLSKFKYSNLICNLDSFVSNPNPQSRSSLSRVKLISSQVGVELLEFKFTVEFKAEFEAHVVQDQLRVQMQVPVQVQVQFRRRVQAQAESKLAFKLVLFKSSTQPQLAFEFKFKLKFKAKARNSLSFQVEFEFVQIKQLAFKFKFKFKPESGQVEQAQV
ncbi:hypothetical protein B0H14DRAFT_2633286 [Mycena olivaceomarginata]|nr:hypothetical protein B0H14DRAFT_2633286 [Mycena olivaceomarginata]